MSDDGQLGMFDRAIVTDEAVSGTEVRQAAWAAVALEQVRWLASVQSLLTTDDVWSTLDGAFVPRPSEPRAMGAVMRRAVKEGYVYITDSIIQSGRKLTSDGATHHTGPVRVYRSLLR